MWKTIFVSNNHKEAKNIENRLISEGFLVKIKGFDEGDGEFIYEITVLEYEAKDAHGFLNESGII